MSDLLKTASLVEKFFQKRNWRFCFIGGIAVLRWGEPRFTQDVDLSLLTGFGGEEEFISVLSQEFESRIENAEDFAIKNRVLLLRSSLGTPIDISLAGLPFEQNMIERASSFEIAPGNVITTCSAEDLLILKAFAGREKDWGDVKGILVRQKRLETELVLRELHVLASLKEEPEIVTKLEALIEDFHTT